MPGFTIISTKIILKYNTTLKVIYLYLHIWVVVHFTLLKRLIKTVTTVFSGNYVGNLNCVIFSFAIQKILFKSDFDLFSSYVVWKYIYIYIV